MKLKITADFLDQVRKAFSLLFALVIFFGVPALLLVAQPFKASSASEAGPPLGTEATAPFEEEAPLSSSIPYGMVPTWLQEVQYQEALNELAVEALGQSLQAGPYYAERKNRSIEGSHLRIPKIGVNAPLVVVGVDRNGVMQAPNNPDVVGWYDFSADFGERGNAVFAGHVDWRTKGAAVFYRLRELQPGDEITIHSNTGANFSYTVTTARLFDPNDAPIREIVGPTPQEAITLITCSGIFDREIREYSHRLIVRAVKNPSVKAGASFGGEFGGS